MEKLLTFLTGHDRNIERNSILWNMISSMLYSLQSALLLLVVTRAGDLNAAGVFGITYSVSQMFASIGSFSMREYQVSDISGQFSFDTYLSSRILTVSTMLMLCFGYSLFTGITGMKLVIIAVLSVYRAVDGLEDVFHGTLQKEGRLDIGDRIFSVRITISSLLFILCFLLTRNLLAASLALSLSSVALGCFLNFLMAKAWKIRVHFQLKGISRLLMSCLPICLGAFLYNYLVNSPKYAIDAILSEEMQGIFNILYMPVFVTSMLSTFIFNPFIYRLGQYWTEKNRRAFIRLVLVLSGIIVLIGLCVVAGGALLGIPVLNLVYGVELDEYKGLFILLLIFGGLSALNSFATIVITVMRRQIFIVAAYAIAAVIDIAVMYRIVEQYSLMGAGLVYGLVLSIIFVIYLMVILQTLFSKKAFQE